MKIPYPIVALSILSIAASRAQTFEISRIDGRPTGHTHDTGGSDPIIDVSTFTAVGVTGSEKDNINGPSLVRLPDWLTDEDRIHPDANYYLYFAHHQGSSIRLAWASELDGDWTLFNMGTAPDRAWGTSGNNTGEQTQGEGVLDRSTVLSFGDVGLGVSNHVASPDVLIDAVNQRFVMYFHAPRNGFGPGGQQSYVTTSSNGLNFNDPNEYGQTDQGPRDVMPTGGYLRAFTVGDGTFAYSNTGELWRAPLLNDAGEVNTLANGDSLGGLWTAYTDHDHGTTNWWDLIPSSDNPIHVIYSSSVKGPRHFGIYTRDHIDPTDTKAYIFYSLRNDSPESIFLTVLDTNNSSTDPSDWTAIGRRIMLEPSLDWEGIDQPLGVSANGSATGVRQLRDPYVFEDTMGTAAPSDDKLYLLYTGEGEEAIGIAELTFTDAIANTAEPQGDLDPANSPSGVLVDYDGNDGGTQAGYQGESAGGNGNGLFEPVTTFTDPFGSGEVTVTFSADRWKKRTALTAGNAFIAQSNLLRDFGGPASGSSATLSIDLPAGDYEVTLYQHESNRSAAETASLQIVDADGMTSDLALVSSFGSTPSAIVVTVYSIRSNGTDDVVFTIDNSDSDTTGAYPINGIEIAPTESLDTDFDGMPDDWEQENGLDPSDDSDRDVDLDSDGYTNFEEWIANTDPDDATSKIAPSYAFTETKLTLIFEGSTERSYSVVTSTDLGQIDSWEIVDGPRRGAGEDDQFVIPVGTDNPRHFYRIVVELP